MSMRHPLTDIPLDQFAPLEQRTSTKRPLSPSATLLSPSKRRILSAEGLYSPEKKRNTVPSKQLFLDPVGSRSPSRRLDFTALSHPSPRNASHRHGRDASPRPETPVSRTGGPPRLAPSPEIASSSSSDASTSFNCASSRDTVLDATHASPPSNFMMIPREIPAFADRQSIHWPGFNVHLDTHISIPTSDSITHASDLLDTSEVDDAKENLRPRKRAGKRVALDEWEMMKPITTERQAREVEGLATMFMLTPSPGSRTMTPREKQQERKQMKFIMVSEMDEEEDVDTQL